MFSVLVFTGWLREDTDCDIVTPQAKPAQPKITE